MSAFEDGIRKVVRMIVGARPHDAPNPAPTGIVTTVAPRQIDGMPIVGPDGQAKRIHIRQDGEGAGKGTAK